MSMRFHPAALIVTVTLALVAVAVGNPSGRTPEAQAAQEQASGKAQNNPACSPKPLRVGASRPDVYVGPDKVSTPTRILYVKPEYPESAKAAKVQGVVVIEAQIELDGHVCNARVVRSIPFLDQSAIDAVLKWRFAPAKVNGVAVPVIMTMTVNFTL